MPEFAQFPNEELDRKTEATVNAALAALAVGTSAEEALRQLSGSTIDAICGWTAGRMQQQIPAVAARRWDDEATVDGAQMEFSGAAETSISDLSVWGYHVGRAIPSHTKSAGEDPSWRLKTFGPPDFDARRLSRRRIA
jgi:hypothetical protein